MSRKTVSLTVLPVHLYKLENSLKSEQLHTYLFFFIFKIISSCCTNRKDVINSEGLRIILKYKSNNGSLWKSDLLQVVKKFRIRIRNSKNLFVHWKHCYNAVSLKGTSILANFPASVHQFYVNILVFVNINSFLYTNNQFALKNVDLSLCIIHQLALINYNGILI